jgi:glycosyltransferase involved in cell wall biosynthesis
MSQRIRRMPWHPGRVYEFMEAADVGIIPVEPSLDAHDEPVPTWQVKSENRLTMRMSVGLPVVASPVPAYAPVIEPVRVNGYIARTRRDWLDHLDELRDPARRKQVGRRARAAVLERLLDARAGAPSGRRAGRRERAM